MKRILVIDNYDSFVYTLSGYLQELGASTEVVRNDSFEKRDVLAVLKNYDAVLISPGPGTPGDAGVSITVVRAALETLKPLFGVCLGLQAIAEAFGGIVTNAEELMHGKTSTIQHDGSAMYQDVPQPFTATRYHSLAVIDETIPDSLLVTSRTLGGVIMGLRHVTAPIYGVQFHPESVMTQGGYHILANWLVVAGLPEAKVRAQKLRPLLTRTIKN